MRAGTWKLGLGVGLVATLGLMGCGGSGGADGNIDQGIVFRAVSFVRGPESIDADQIRCTEPTTQNAIVDSSWVIRLAEQSSTRIVTIRSAIPARVHRAREQSRDDGHERAGDHCRVRDPRSGHHAPENSISFGLRINPTSSLDESSSGQVNLAYSQLVGQMIPEQMMTWLEQNQNVLPSTPYSMSAFFRARGQADDGTRYTTNEIGYQFTITR